MKRNVRVLVFLAVALGVLLVPAALMMTAPKHPTALIRVVDAAGHPVAGAKVVAQGLRTKPGPYISGWYSWEPEKNGVTHDPVITDQSGFASVPYPKYVFEKIETGTVCLSVDHPDFVADRPERVVATAPPGGAPWRIWLDYVWGRIIHRALSIPTDPVVLQKGGILKLSARPGSAGPQDAPMYAQVSGEETFGTNFWMRPEPGVLLTHRLGSGLRLIRAVRFDAQGWAWFSGVTNLIAGSGQSNEMVLDFQRGVTLRGQLDSATPRPIIHGRLILHVWPANSKPETDPPVWHTWTNIAPDGTFEISSLPPGNLEVVALCDGYVMTNGPGKFKMRYPQKHVLGTNDLTITVGMEKTARLEVHVTDDQGQPLKDARVATWPNVRYGEWAAVILGGDCYNMADLLTAKSRDMPHFWDRSPGDFNGVTDGSGMAVLSSIPVDVTELAVEHEHYVMPAVQNSWGEKQRQAAVKLVVGVTNTVWIKLEPRGKTAIGHY